MTQTPWGNSEGLRDRMLHPKTGLPREAILENQRERLFGAMVAAVAKKGYEDTSVADLVELSGVSRATFYELYASKEECFLSALEAIIGVAFAVVEAAFEQPGTWEERARRAFDALLQLILTQPATARMWLLDVYSVGPNAEATLNRGIGDFEALLSRILTESPERAAMPTEMIRSFVGSVGELARTSLARGEEAELSSLMPELLELELSYQPPPKPLRRVPGRRFGNTQPEPSLEPHDQAERALRAFIATVAERGYAKTTIAEVVARASMSMSTFYAHFGGKEDAMLAAMDSGGAQLLAATLPAARRAPDWPHSIRAGFGALLNYLATRPYFARLVAIEVYAAGPRAIEVRRRAVRLLAEPLAAGFERYPNTPAIVIDAIGGGISMLVYDRIQKAGPESLPALAPIATYIALFPFLGAEAACEVANSDGRRRTRQRAAG